MAPHPLHFESSVAWPANGAVGKALFVSSDDDVTVKSSRETRETRTAGTSGKSGKIEKTENSDNETMDSPQTLH